MNSVYRLLLLAFTGIVLLTLSSCGAIVKAKANKYASIEEGAIPSNFGEGNTEVLFVTKGKKSYDKYLKSNIKKVYKGKYVFVMESDLKSDKYNNVAKYRYLFDFERESYGYHSSNTVIYGQSAIAGGNNATGQVRRFAIRDRQEEKTYTMPMTSSFWSKLQRVYLKNMEAVRIQNSTEVELSK
ncbi:unnamed protein product [Ectocarpus sp. 12 AP-2014]